MNISKYHFFVFTMTAFLVCLFSSALSVTTVSVSGAETGSYYLSEKSNVDTIHATTVGALPCIGEAKILVFYTDFKDGPVNWTKTKQEVENMFFSEAGKSDPSVAYSDADSLRSYYYRSSYGKVDITGTVYEYQTQNPTTHYNSIHTVLDEIIAYYRDRINWDDYDGNHDGYIDGIYVIAKNRHSWGGPNFVGGYSNTVGNKKICKACFLDSYNFSTMCHETCHMFGPADMYSGVSVNPSGIQTACIMDSGYGDLPSATKFVLGWLDHAVFVSSDNIGTHKLRSYTNYGDCLIIYPNGDPTNRNWFFVEYVTNEGNNCQSGSQYGLRVWKTQMYLDENYDIIGAKEFCYGSPSSPYNYLEAVHPDGVWNYYMQAGQKISPYTYPSTAYSDTFYNEGGAKFLKDLTFSGIEIAFTGLADKTATVDIRIEAQADATRIVNATLTSLSSGESSAFLDNKDLIQIATLSSDVELKINAPITLSSKNGDRVYTLETKQSKNKREILLYITPSMLESLKEQSDWTVSVSNVTTYYGASLNVTSSAETFDFSAYPTPLIDCEGNYKTNFNMSYEYDLSCFRISDSVILTIFYDDTIKKLYWGEINVQSNTTEKFELLLPKDIVIEEWTSNETISVWEDYNTYFVHIGNYVCAYSDKTLISSLDISTLGNYLAFKGTDNSSLFVDRDNKIYEMGFEKNVITFESVPVKISDVGFFRVDNIYSFLDNQYIITFGNMVRIADTKKNTVKDLFYADNNEHRYNCTAVYFSNGHYYVFASSADLIMYEYDTEFRLLKETCILKDLSSTIWGPFQLNVRFSNHSWIIYFESVSNANAISYSNTYLIICTESGKVTNYYKYGDSSYRYVCQFVPVSQYKLIGIKAFSFMYIHVECVQHVYGEWTQTLAPTCTAEGSERRACAVCDHFETRTVAAKGHTEVVDTAVEPTCTKNGRTEGKHCSVCRKVLIAQSTVAATGHTAVIDAAVAPTCAKIGRTEGKHCSVCGETLVAQKVVAKLAHTPSDWITDIQVSCSTAGSKHKECIVCHKVLETQTIDKLEHAQSDWIEEIQATCSAAGRKHKECTVCHEVLETQAIDKLEHVQSDWIIETQATCSTAGNKHKECTVCHEILETQTIDKLEHVISDWIIDTQATCSMAGSKHKECTVCHKVLERQEIEELEHNASDWIIETQATCSTAGSKHKECTVCHKVLERQEIEKLEHNSSDWITDTQPTCSMAGSKHKECTLCHEFLETQEIKKLSHNPSDWIVETQATCSAVGSKHKECTICHEILERQEIEELEHNASDWIIETQATCSTTGSKHKECTVCHDVLERQEITKLEHMQSDWIEEIQATCSAAGSKHKECTICHEILERQEITKLEHVQSDWITDTQATCSTTGSKRKECTVCHEVLERQEIEKLEHVQSDWIIAPQATCSAAGSKYKECTVCHKVLETQEISKLEHNSSDWITDTQASCAAAGRKHKECTLCHKVLETQEIKKPEHNFGEWETTKEATESECGEMKRICSECGLAETKVIPQKEEKGCKSAIDDISVVVGAVLGCAVIGLIWLLKRKRS